MKTLRKHSISIAAGALTVVLVRHEVMLASLRADVNTIGQVLFQLLSSLGLI